MTAGEREVALPRLLDATLGLPTAFVVAGALLALLLLLTRLRPR